MPSAVSGLTGEELVNYIQQFIGNYNSDFKTWLETTLPLAEQRLCQLHDWRFLHKRNLSLTVTSGTVEYTLNSSSIGFFMASSDVKSVYSRASGIYLKPTTLEELRRYDTKQDDGSANDNLTMWAPAGENSIEVHPPTFADTELKIDGKVSPGGIYDLDEYPTIPVRYQYILTTYLEALALGREDDDRANQWQQQTLIAVRQAIQDDMAKGASSADEPRIKHWKEAAFDGVGGNLEQAWFASLFANW